MRHPINGENNLCWTFEIISFVQQYKIRAEMGNGGQSSLLTLGFAVVIRSAFACGYGATGEMLNRYVGGERKRGPTTDLCGIENSCRGIRSRRAETSPPPAQGCLCISFITGWISQTAKDES